MAMHAGLRSRSVASDEATNGMVCTGWPASGPRPVVGASGSEERRFASARPLRTSLTPGRAAAGAKRKAEIPQETMIEPHLSKAPTGRPGSMTWEEIWVFQTTPKTAVRITFTEDGKGGADYAIRMN